MKTLILFILLAPLTACSLLNTQPVTKVAPNNSDRNSAVIYANLYSPIIPADPKVLENAHA
jgi:hypothetical protein